MFEQFSFSEFLQTPLVQTKGKQSPPAALNPLYGGQYGWIWRNSMNLYQGEDIRVDIRNMLFIRGQFAWNRLPRAVGMAPRQDFKEC